MGLSDTPGLLAYGRRLDDHWVIVAVPLNQGGSTNLSRNVGSLRIPDEAPQRWVNIFTGEEHNLMGEVNIADDIRKFPVLLLQSI